MRTLAAMRPARRGPSTPPPTWLIVMVVPLAATCILAFPTTQQYNPTRLADATVQIDRVMANTERDRRSGEVQREEADTHDPPHHVSFWADHASPDRDDLARPEAAHPGAMLALAPLGDFPSEYRLPGDLTLGQHDSRGPPTVG